MTELNKTCIKCKITYKASSEFFFYRNKEKGWLSSWCKTCKKIHFSQNKEKNNLAQRKRRGIKPCSICNSIEKEKGLMYCKKCLSEKKKVTKRIDKSIYKKRLKDSMPAWADKNKIKQFYKNRPIGHDIDHVIPLRGKLVCGLHVIENLQYLNKVENMKKSNHYSLEHDGVK